VTFGFILGMVLNGTTVLIPQFLQNFLGYNAQLAGLAQTPGALVLLFMMPLAGLLAAKFDPRIIIATGFLLTSLGLFHVTSIHYGVSFGTMVNYRIFQTIGIPLIFIPISTLNYVGVPRDKFNQVSGISNFFRNLGGATGISMLTNFIDHQSQTHRSALAANANYGNPLFEREFQGLTHSFIAMGGSPSDAAHRALAQISAQIDLQAGVLSFANSFWIMGVLVLCLVPLPFFMRRPSTEEAQAGAVAH
jgi:DHA2 family multidrug resistance protein